MYFWSTFSHRVEMMALVVGGGQQLCGPETGGKSTILYPEKGNDSG